MAVEADVRFRSHVLALFEQAEAELEGIDVLVISRTGASRLTPALLSGSGRRSSRRSSATTAFLVSADRYVTGQSLVDGGLLML